MGALQLVIDLAHEKDFDPEQLIFEFESHELLNHAAPRFSLAQFRNSLGSMNIVRVPSIIAEPLIPAPLNMGLDRETLTSSASRIRHTNIPPLGLPLVAGPSSRGMIRYSSSASAGTAETG